MRKVGLVALLLSALALSACGGGNDDQESEGPQAACDGDALIELRLPARFPTIDPMIYTKQETNGPTGEIVEGYFKGDVQEAHDEWKKGLEDSGFDVTSDEVEAHGSEVAWKGDGHTGIVAISDDCGDSEKMYVKITHDLE